MAVAESPAVRERLSVGSGASMRLGWMDDKTLLGRSWWMTMASEHIYSSTYPHLTRLCLFPSSLGSSLALPGGLSIKKENLYTKSLSF